LILEARFFSLKFTKYHLAAGLCPDPLGELKRSPRPLAAIRGPNSKGRGREGKGREGRGEWRGKGGGTLFQGVRGIDVPDCMAILLALIGRTGAF